MKRIIILFFTIINYTIGYSQIKCDFLTQVQELDFSCKDSLDGVITLGDYTPCGFLKIDDSTFIIAANISNYIQQPGDSILKQNPALYYKKLDTVLPKDVHYGKIICLNKNFHKKWEISFEGNISKIEFLPNGTFLVIWQNYTNLIWTANIDEKGNFLWKKTYKVKRLALFDDVKLDKSNNTYIIATADRFSLFKVDFPRNKMHLIKLSPNGDKIFDKIISNKKYDPVDYRLIIDSSNNLYVEYSFLKEYLEKGKYHEEVGCKINKYAQNGKIIDTVNSYSYITSNENNIGTIACSFKHDTFYISKWSFKKEIPIDSIEINGPFSKGGGYSIGKCRLIKLNDEYLFICDISGRYLFCLLDKNLHFKKYYLYDEFPKMMDDVIDVFKIEESELIMLNKNVITLPHGSSSEFSTKAQLLKLNYNPR